MLKTVFEAYIGLYYYYFIYFFIFFFSQLPDRVNTTIHLPKMLTDLRTINGLSYWHWSRSGFPGQGDLPLNQMLHVVPFLWKDNCIIALPLRRKTNSSSNIVPFSITFFSFLCSNSSYMHTVLLLSQIVTFRLNCLTIPGSLFLSLLIMVSHFFGQLPNLSTLFSK